MRCAVFYISFKVGGSVSAKRYPGCDCAETVRLFHGRLSHGQLLLANLAISSSALCFLRPVTRCAVEFKCFLHSIMSFALHATADTGTFENKCALRSPLFHQWGSLEPSSLLGTSYFYMHAWRY